MSRFKADFSSLIASCILFWKYIILEIAAQVTPIIIGAPLYFSAFGREPHTGRLITHIDIDPMISETFIREQVKANEIKVEKLKGSVFTELEGLRDTLYDNDLQMLSSLFEEYLDSFNLRTQEDQITLLSLPTSGFVYWIIRNIQEKASNGEILSQVESDILNFGKRAFSDFSMILSMITWSLYDENQWRNDPNRGESPYLVHYDHFISELTRRLYKFGMINRNDLNLLENIVKFAEFYGNKERRSNLKCGEQFNIAEDTLDIWFARSERKISLDSTLSNKEYIMNSIKELFEVYYDISGFSLTNMTSIIRA